MLLRQVLNIKFHNTGQTGKKRTLDALLQLEVAVLHHFRQGLDIFEKVVALRAGNTHNMLAFHLPTLNSAKNKKKVIKQNKKASVQWSKYKNLVVLWDIGQAILVAQ